MSSKYPLVAIVGAGALFPGSVTEGRFWQNILQGEDLLSAVPESHWLLEDYYDPDPQAADRTYANRGGFLPEVEFAPMDFGVPPSIIPATDTAQLLALNIAQRVLEQASGDVDLATLDRDKISVVLGVASATELVGHMSGRLQRPVWERALGRIGLNPEQIEAFGEEINASYTPWQESTFPGLLGNVVAGRIANRLDLGGTNCVVDAACASSLAALEIGLNELYLGQSEMVITGGVDTLNDILMFMCFSRTTALSPSGDCRPFSDQADGTMLGEGIGMFALKRLEDAERDGNAIYAVIKGLGSSSDGRAKSIYAPVSSGQAKALRRAYEHAGYGPETVELIEAHGTGTKAGDAAEFGGLSVVFDQETDCVKRQWCALGSVKSQIGHTKASAGAAGLFKTAMALHHKVIPPTIKVDRPNPNLDLERSPFYLSTSARPWIRDAAHPRRASVSSFGFGGTNFHVALEEYVGSGKRAPKLRAQPVELLVWSHATPAGLSAELEALSGALLKDEDDALFRHLAYQSVLNYDARLSARLAIVAEGAHDLHKKIKLALNHLQRHPEAAYTTPNGVHYGFDERPGQVAFLFPGQGSQYVNMGNQLAIHFDRARAVWDRAADLHLDEHLALHQVVFPVTSFEEDTKALQSERLTATEWAQPAIGAMSLATLRLLEAMGLEPACVAGHSFGEITALMAAGALGEEEFLKVARKRGELMAAASSLDGSMTAIVAEIERVQALLEAWDVGVVVANHNSPTQVVISGTTSAIERAEARLAEEGLKFKRLKVATAFHSPVVSDSSAPFEAFLGEVEVGAPKLDVYSNSQVAPYPSEPDAIRHQLAAQIAQPVRFVEQLRAMVQAGVRTFVEVGPEGVLSGLVERTVCGDQAEVEGVLAIATDRRGKHGVETLLTALARLIARGVELDLTLLWEGHAEPIDPRTVKKPPFTLTLNGANYGKPDPRREPSERARQVAEAMNTPRQVERIVEVPVEVIVERIVEVPVEAPGASLASSTTAAAPQALSLNASVSSENDWLQALDRMQQETARAQLEYQRTMADAHTAFLRSAQGSMQHVLTAHTAAAPPPHGVESASPRPPVTSSNGKASNGANGHASTPLFVAPELLAAQQRLAATPPSPPAPLQARAVSPSSPTPSRPKPAAPFESNKPPAVSARAGHAEERAPASTPTAPAALTQQIAAPRAPAAPAIDLVKEMMEVVAEKTGYPTEMLELSMELEADLGVDSIKRVEILSSMQERVPSLPEVETAKMASLVTLQQIVDYMASLLPSGATAPSKSAASASAQQQVAAPTAPTVDLVKEMMEVVAEKTGYPTEMLELSMELEADLGVDSIKRVEILSSMQERVPSLPEVETAKMASLVTLQQIVDYMASLLPAQSSSAPSATSAPAALTQQIAAPRAPAAPAIDLVKEMMEVVAEKTGYPTEMLELSMELEADLGVDSIKRVEILSSMQERVPSLPEVETAKMASLVTLQQIVDYMASLLPSGATAPSKSAASASAQQQVAVPRASAAPAIDLVKEMMEVVAEKTGYPTEMLELSMELEADLGVDSIKRVEILSSMQERVPSLPEVETAKMASLVTLQQIVDYMASLLPDQSPSAPSATRSVEALSSQAPGDDADKASTERVARYEVHRVKAPSRGLMMSGLTQTRTAEILSDDQGVAQALATLLEQRGIQATLASHVEALSGEASMLLCLSGLNEVDAFEDVVAMTRQVFLAAAKNAERFGAKGGVFVTVQDSGGDFARSQSGLRAWTGGLGALAKTAAKEWPSASVRAIDLERAGRTPAQLAEALIKELWSGGLEIEVGLKASGERSTLATVERPVGEQEATTRIDADSVIVVSGGARGVTAASVIALAKKTQARFVLLGRTALKPEPELFEGKQSEADLKRAALQEAQTSGVKISPKDLARRVDRIKADREVRATLSALKRAGSEARYASVDVRDAASLAALFKEVREELGPITGLVHGAGVLADALLAQKTGEHFDRVFGTKIEGLHALLEATADDPLDLICLFSSVAARTGNAGQADYAIANEALNRVALELAIQRPECHVKSLGWGPWEGGMVTPQLKALFEQRGVTLIPVQAGAEAFVAELLEASKSAQVEVVLGGGVVDGGLDNLVGEELGLSSTLHVDKERFGFLRDHQIQGNVVLPVVLSLEACARAAISSRPGHRLKAVRDLKVLKGVALSNFEGAGDLFEVALKRAEQGALLATLSDRTGLKRYEATLELKPAQTQSEVLAWEGLKGQLGPSPWGARQALYGDDTLFHGPSFQVIESIQGLGEQGARATLRGLIAQGLEPEAWTLDVLLVDGCLQLALLWGLQVSGGQSLPMRLGEARFYEPPERGPFVCELVKRAVSAQRTVSDMRVTRASDGAPVCDLRGVEMYVVPGGTAASR